MVVLQLMYKFFVKLVVIQDFDEGHATSVGNNPTGCF